MREYEQKVASIHAWVIATKAENDELRKEVKRITGEHTHLQESVIKPLENVLVPVGLYSHQSYAACVTALREANADLIQRAEAAEKFSKGLEINLAAVIQRAEAAETALAEAQREINALWGDGGRKLLAEAAEDTTLLDKAQRIGIAINGYGHGDLYDKSSVRAAIRAVREKV